MHGLLATMVRGKARKHLDIEGIAQIKAATGMPLILHGGSGTDDDDFRRAIEAGITIVHISTELRLAWRQGLEAALAAEPDCSTCGKATTKVGELRRLQGRGTNGSFFVRHPELSDASRVSGDQSGDFHIDSLTAHVQVRWPESTLRQDLEIRTPGSKWWGLACSSG